MKIFFTMLLFIVPFRLMGQISIEEQTFSTTVKIVTTQENGVFEQGTGIYYAFFIDGLEFHAVITNRHVVEGTHKCSFVIRAADSLGNPNYKSNYLFNFDSAKWIYHDSEDLAMIVLNPNINGDFKKITNRIPYMNFFNASMIPDTMMERTALPIMDVFMIGYPMGITDGVNNIPILRRGVTATPFFLNFENSHRFLVDIPIFPGSSGSPVIARSSNGYTLLGIATSSINTNNGMPLNLASVIKSYEILNLIDKFKKLSFSK